MLLKTGKFRANTVQIAMPRFFADPSVWTSHRHDLIELADLAIERGSRPIAVLWPWLRDVESTAPLTSTVADVLRSEQLPVVDLGIRFADRDPADLMVGSLDGHANARVHRKVAELLLREVCRLIEDDRELDSPGC